jgi:hypothetical protein
MESKAFLEQLKPGDKVWVGNGSYSRNRGVQTVARLTNTIVYLLRHGCTQSTEFDTYNRQTGRQRANLMFRDYITGLATPEDVAKFEAEKAQEAETRKRNEEAKASADEKRKVLEGLFPDSNYVGVSESHDTRCPKGDCFEVRLLGLTENQVRKLAELAKEL